MLAIIIAGGKGIRLRPYTSLIPKPLVPVGSKFAVLEIIIMQLAKNGYKEIIIAANHMGSLLKSYFGNGKKFNIKINYSFEKEELGTIGPLKIQKNLPKNFLVMNSDLICDIDYAKIFKSHESSNSLMTVITKQKKFPVDFGVIKTQDNRILEFKEKPIIKKNVCIGINLFNKKILKYIPKNKKFSFDDLINYLLNKKITINSYSYNGYWLDLGRPEDYDEANDNYKSLFKKLSIE